MDYVPIEVTIIQRSTDQKYEFHYSETSTEFVDYVDGDGNLFLKQFESTDGARIEFKINPNSTVNNATFWTANGNPDAIWITPKNRSKSCRKAGGSPTAPGGHGEFDSFTVDGTTASVRRINRNDKNFCYALRFNVPNVTDVVQHDPEVQNGGNRPPNPFTFQAYNWLLLLGALALGLLGGAFIKRRKS